MAFKPKLTIDQIKQIKELSATKTDAEIAELLNVDKRTIQRYRIKLGIVKGNKPKKQITTSRVSETKRKKDFYKNFQNSQQYKILEGLYTEEELQFYFEEYWVHVKELHKAGEELTAAEKRALDNLIQTRIRMNRFLTEERKLLQQLQEKPDGLNGLGWQEQQEDLQERLDKISRSIKDLQNLYISIQKTLELTKQERTKKKQSTKVNILTLLEEMKDDKLKLGIGYWSSLSEMSMRKIFNSWRSGRIIETQQTEEELSL